METKEIIAKCIEEATNKTPMRVLTNGAVIGLDKREQLLAEISFNAGIKDMVDWVMEQDIGDKSCVVISIDDWQAKLQEWGISEPEIDEAQELADLRHNASDDTIGA